MSAGKDIVREYFDGFRTTDRESEGFEGQPELTSEQITEEGDT